MTPEQKEQIIKQIKSQPGVDLTKLPPATTLLISTFEEVYELVVVNPIEGLVQVTSTCAPLKKTQLCKYEGGVFSVNQTVPGWIGRGLAMRFIGQEGGMVFVSNQVNTCRVAGPLNETGKPSWKYEIYEPEPVAVEQSDDK